jgi:hypothetical protein
MGHYFFEVQDGQRLPDPSGIDCPSDEAAVKQAKIIAAQIAADVPASANRRVAVIDERGREIASLTIGENARAP